MIATIARKELIELYRDGRFRVLVILFTLLLVASVATGLDRQKTAAAGQTRANEVMRTEWLEQGDKNPHMAGHYGTFVFKPVQVLSLFDTGVESYTGTQVFLEAHKQNDFHFRPAQDRTLASRFAELTAATILQLLIPLVIFLLTFAAFTSERESGTLRQLLSLGLGRETFALGKTAGVTLALLTVLIPFTVLGTAALLLNGATLNEPQLMSRWALLVISYLIYFAICVFIGLAVSAIAGSTRTALFVLLVVWFACTLIVPRGATVLARFVYPTSTLAFQQAMERDFAEGIDGHNAENERNDELKARVLAEYGVTEVKDLPVNHDGMLMQADEDYRAIVMDRRFGELWKTWIKQADLQAISGVIVPVQAIRNLSMGLADTDLAAQQTFATATESYRRSMVRVLNDDMTKNSKTGDWDYEAGRALYEQIPPFEYRSLSVSDSLRNHMTSLLSLFLWLVISVIFLTVAMRRLRPL